MRKVELNSYKGVGSLLEGRILRCQLNDEEFKDMLDWVACRDDLKPGDTHLSLVEKKGENDG